MAIEAERFLSIHKEKLQTCLALIELGGVVRACVCVPSEGLSLC